MNRFFSVILSSLSKYHVQDFLCRVFQMLKRDLAQFNSKINGPFFVIQGCIQALKLLLSSTATDGKSGRKLKLDNVWPSFSSCNAVPRIIIFHDALLTYSNHGAVRTYEKFCY